MLTGRIVKGVAGLYFVDVNNEIFECSARGIFRKNKITPIVGDFVKINHISNHKGTIEEIIERKNCLIRPKVSNIDCAIITFSIVSPNINLDLLDKFLILAESNKINKIIICINKCDLVKKDELDTRYNIYKSHFDIVFFSSFDKRGLTELKSLINNKVTVFAGPSGVGKSSIINLILDKHILKTGEISKKIERGKHTTRQVELIKAWDNTFIVDSPGFTSLSLEFIDKNYLDYYFREFQKYLENCKFYDCKHILEPECMVKKHIGKDIPQERYDRYIKFFNELNN